MKKNFETWTRTEVRSGTTTIEVFADSARLAAIGPASFPPVDGSSDDASFATDLLQFVGEVLDGDFLQTWNSQGVAKQWRGDGAAVVCVIELARDGDEDGPMDTPTLIWKKHDGQFLLVASKEWRDGTAAELAGLGWPERSEFVDVEVAYGE